MPVQAGDFLAAQWLLLWWCGNQADLVAMVPSSPPESNNQHYLHCADSLPPSSLPSPFLPLSLLPPSLTHFPFPLSLPPSLPLSSLPPSSLPSLSLLPPSLTHFPKELPNHFDIHIET